MSRNSLLIAEIKQSYTPGRCSRDLGRFVTQVNGHIRILLGWRQPSLKRFRVSYMCMPPRGVC